LVDDLLIVAASGRLAAYDVATGKPRWFAQTGGGGYSSPQADDDRRRRTGSADERLGSDQRRAGRWQAALQHPLEGGSRIVQPALTAEGDLLMTVGGEGMGGEGVRRIAIAHGPGGWSAKSAGPRAA